MRENANGSRIHIVGMAIGMSICGVANADSISIPASKDAMIFGTSGNADTGNASGKGPALFAGARARNQGRP